MSDFTVSRSATIHAPAAAVQALVDDFRAWQQWSPWEGLDPSMERTYSGPAKGLGARYTWKGNSKAGSGSMEIVAAEPGRTAITLTFLKPWKATNAVELTFVEDDGVTAVTWTMAGTHTGLGRVFALLMNMDKFIGKDFEKGLSAMKGLAEA